MKKPEFQFGWRIALAALIGFCLVVPGNAAFSQEEKTGEQIYRQSCAACHGETGEGTDEMPQALAGDKSIAELAKLIDETMPEDDPAACVGDDARKVAEYIYEAFYSPVAQARNKPPRIELSRLTVRQYQSALADLIGGFRDAGSWGEERGLEGRYYNERRFRREPQFARTDATVQFQFGEAAPAENVNAEEYGIRWEGSVLAPDTGEYEFIVKTENATRLWVNDTQQALIDAWVKSGDETEYRASIFLLGGRVYPLRLEFFKSKREKTGSIALEWKPPHRTAEVIPARHLSTTEFPELFVTTTAFPPDDRSMGYERANSISKEWEQATTHAAIEAAGYVAANLEELADADDEDDRQEKVREFCRRFVEGAFRRPLSDEQRRLFVDRHFEEAPDEETAVKRVVLLALKSPRFLYREIGGAGDAFDTASRLSFALWDSIPDKPLLEAAAKNELTTREQITAQAERMVADLRTKSKLREFLHQWLKVDQLDNISKDGQLFPEFDEHAVSDLRTSLDLFLEDVIWNEPSDFRQLLLADSLYLNGRLAKFYGADLPPDAPFQKVVFDPQQRAGVLSHPLLLTGFAYHATSSPIHRGVFVARSLLGRTLRPPPEAVAPLSPDLHAGLSTRERVILQTSPNMCQSCHAMINPLGFPLEHYDAIGRYRTEEKGKPVDATGNYLTQSGNMAEFTGVRELAAFLAASDETHAAFAEQLFHQFVKQPLRAYGPDQPERLQRAFVENDFHVQRLLVEVAATAATPPK